MAKSIANQPFVIDAGNAFVKAVHDSTEIIFVHAIAPLASEAEYDAGLSRYGKSASMDFIRIGGKAFAIGDTAMNYRTQHLEGAPKYQRDYYGILFAAAIARTFPANSPVLAQGLMVVASHASRDYEFHKQLQESIKGKWDFECGGTRYRFTVTKSETYEEPFGGYARQAFRQTNKGKWETPLFGQHVGIIDVGGGTVGVMQVASNGNVVHNASDSADNGMNRVTETMVGLLKSGFPKIFQRGSSIPLDRVRDAIATGCYVGMGRELDVSKQRDLALAPLLNDVERLYTRKMNGGLGLDAIILTGGGNEVCNQAVYELTGHAQVYLAEQAGQLQFANVRGAANFYAVLAASGM